MHRPTQCACSCHYCNHFLFAEAQQAQYISRLLAFFVCVCPFRTISLAELPIINLLNFLSSLLLFTNEKTLGFNERQQRSHPTLKKELKKTEKKPPAKPRKNLTIINQFSIFRLHLTLCACYQKHTQSVVGQTLIDRYTQQTPSFHSSLQCQSFTMPFFLFFSVPFFFSSGSGFSGVIFCPVETKI